MVLSRAIVISGVPRSGKSSVARFLAKEHGFAHICSDDIRREFAIEFGSNDNREGMVNHVVRYRALEHLMMAQDVVIDTTAMFRTQRRLFFDLNVFAQGKVYTMNVSKCLISLEVTDDVWKQRQLAAGRSLQQKAFYFGKFEPVSPEEVAELDSHLHFKNNSAPDFEHIKQELPRLLSLSARI